MDYLNNLYSLENKTAVAVGAGGVLAGAMAIALARAGARVAILDLNPEAANDRAEQISGECSVDTLAIAIDATDRASLETARDRILDAWGGVDILLNAPGINSDTPFFEIEEEEWDRIMDVNLKSMFLACQVFGQVMIEGGAGSIINISSASSGPPLSKVFTYSISKAGVNNLTQWLAGEWARNNVRVNAISPGFFPAEQNRKLLTEERTAQIHGHTPMNRFGEAEELAGAAIWLASAKASSFVTGAIIRVDGGFTATTI